MTRPILARDISAQADSKPLGKFGSALIRKCAPHPIQTLPVKLDPGAWPLNEEN